MILTVHALRQYLVQSHVDRVRALVALVQASVVLVLDLVDLVLAHPPQGGLIWVVSRQVVLGPGFGSMFVRGVRRKQVCCSHVVLGWG